MSSESLESDNISSKEDIELKEFIRSPDRYPDSGASADEITSCGQSITQIGTSEDEICDSAISFLNSSDENNQTLDINQASLLSLEAISSETPIRKASSQEEPSLGRDLSMNSLGPLIRRVSSMNTLETPRPSRTSQSDSQERTSTIGVSSFDSLQRLSTRSSYLNPIERPSTRSVPSPDKLKGHPTREVPPPDVLNGLSARSAPSPDPMEGPSTRTVWFSGSAEGSLTSVHNSHSSEPENDEHFYSESITERDECWFRALAWLNSFLRRHSRQIRHSVYYPLIHVALIAVLYSAGYMGCIHLNLCDGCPKLPNFVYLVGLFGTSIMFLQLIAVLSQRHFSPPLTGQEFNTCMMSLCILFFMFLTVEIFTTYTCEPVFIPPHKEFCAKAFYNYAYYTNIAVPFVILLLMLIHIPGYYDPAETE